MKKLMLSISLFLSILSANAQLSCGSYNAFDSMFSNVGNFHNAALANIKDNFVKDGNITTKSAAIDYIKNFNKSYFNSQVNSYLTHTMSSAEIDSIFENSKNFVDYDAFQADFESTSSDVSVDNIKSQIEGGGLIDAGNMDIFTRTVELVKNSTITQNGVEFEDSLIAITNDWLAYNDGRTDNGKELTGNILSIGLKSCEWWRNNPDVAKLMYERMAIFNGVNAGPNNHEEHYDVFVFPWLADLAGALVSGGIYAIVQGNNFTWNNLALATVGGAITSSGGVVNKVIKWLKDLF